MIDNDFCIREVNVYRDPELSLSIDKETGEETLKLAARENQEEIAVHVLVDPDGSLVKPVCLYLFWKKDEEQAKSTATDAKALLLYFRFLHQNNLNYWQFPHSKSRKQTFRFADFLVSAIQSDDIAISTAKTYLRVIVNFYKFLGRNNLIEFSERNKPFDFEIVSLRQSGMLAHSQRVISVQTTNLMKKLPREQKKHVTRTLSPLTQEHLEAFLEHIKEIPEDKALIFEVGLATGMRLQEVLTIPESIIFNPDSSYAIPVSIGPKNGVKTKFSKQRYVEFPASLMFKLYQYLWSPSRQKYTAKGKNDERKLFISRQGKPFNSNTIEKSFSDIRKVISGRYRDFNYAIHDLRSTYATYTLHKLWEEKGSLRAAASILQELMGHNSFTSTFKYVEFIESNALMLEHADHMSDIFQLFGGSDGEK
ncbi:MULTISPECIES: tyrosine-type recombinase/integrase [Vibrio]|uniref:tyrosine-type recombinase/integrase n=1 Tax=Vibrio TaxID=662 RepID=UPI000B8E7026|nr:MULTISPECIES: site-specific integrase [Vibrio]MDE1238841.1 site-specific integrase [Vibrio aestuarianus]NAW91322.1 tyrosine-type recombinase/integrase [Vibrio sp. V24_P1S3T111]OXX20978.1 integrase [Vibrio sp. V06_P1A73T115]OXX21832.1 integrase [Vibrio sp. V05_P4A8T149]OXX28043.1 integrase [Vibrio sp. V14_P6S14T42]